VYHVSLATSKIPSIIYAVRRMNWNINFVTMSYGLWWRKHRRTFHQYFHPSTVTKYQPIQRREARALLHQLLLTPDNFFHHIRQQVLCLMMPVCYRVLHNIMNTLFLWRSRVSFPIAKHRLYRGFLIR
jgi:hypothetical protein